MHFPIVNVVHSLNLISSYIYFFSHRSLSEFITGSIGMEIPRSTCPLIEQMCPNIQSCTLPVIMANISNTAKMEDAEDFLKKKNILSDVKGQGVASELLSLKQLC